MLQTYEAVLEPDGQIRFVDETPVPSRSELALVLVTFLDAGNIYPSHQDETIAPAEAGKAGV
jgi:hypothetical protein